MTIVVEHDREVVAEEFKVEVESLVILLEARDVEPEADDGVSFVESDF